MTRLVEVLVAMSAVCGIAGFLGVRAAVRRTLRTLGRQPEDPRPYIDEEDDQDGAPLDEERARTEARNPGVKLGAPASPEEQARLFVELERRRREQGQ